MARFSDAVMDQVVSPRNGGSMANPDLAGHAGTPGRGAFMVLFLRLENDRVTSATYHTMGCGPTIACGSVLSELMTGRTIDECRKVGADHLIDALDGVPPDKLHCPALAIAALRNALSHAGPRND